MMKQQSRSDLSVSIDAQGTLNEQNEEEEIQYVRTASKGGGGGGGNSLRPYSQQRPMRRNLSSCLGLIHNGQNHSYVIAA